MISVNMNKVTVYSEEQAENIASEFSRLQETCYLDNAGATLYSEQQIKNILEDLSSNIYANPHARSISSQSTSDAINVVRYKILSFFETTPDEYSVIFTSGATAALKLIAETFDFNGGTLAYLEDNHTSVLGMRSFAPNFREVKLTEAVPILSSGFESKKPTSRGKNCLFVFPAQSNFAGSKYPLSWIEAANNGALGHSKSENWYTVLDAACFCSTSHLNLRNYKPDFVTISFYKIFGYPAGCGALLIKKSAEPLLKKRYFGGGTILMALSSENVMVPKPNIHERFEDGTVSFLSILSLNHGFNTFRRLQLTPDLIGQHTFNVAKYTFETMLSLHHNNGQPVTVMNHEFGFEEMCHQGGIINFNLMRANGEYVGYAEVMHIASLHGILLRTGCFCNPGACQKALQLTADEVKKHFETGHVCGDEHDLINGWPSGSVRISFGYMSTYEDADRFLGMIEKCFVIHPVVRKPRKFEKCHSVYTRNKQHSHVKIDGFGNERKTPLSKTLSDELNNQNHYLHKTIYKDGNNSGHSSSFISDAKGELVKIFLYPVKSCAPFEVKHSWKLTRLGLEYDRRWMIINPLGSCVSQKQIKNLCTLKPILDFDCKLLRLRINESEMAVPLEPYEVSHKDAYFCDSQVCGDKIQGFDCGDKVAEWLSDNLEKPGLRLLRQCDFTEELSGRKSKEGPTVLSLANKAEYLLINLATVRWLKDRIPEQDSASHDLDSIVARFRANYVVDFREPFIENTFSMFEFDDVILKFTGTCTRCQMICIDQKTGEISKEPLQTLSKELKGKMKFGVYLSRCNPSHENTIFLGCSVRAYFES